MRGLKFNVLSSVLVVSLILGNVMFYSDQVSAEGQESEKVLEESKKVSVEQKERVKKFLSKFFETYYDGLVNQKVPELDRYVEENNNTNLYLSMLKSDVERSIILGTGYKDYQFKIIDYDIDLISQKSFKVKFIYDLEYHYKMSEEILSAEYNKEFQIEVKLNDYEELLISRINSDSEEYDNYKEEITETCIKENGRLSIKILFLPR